ncbi:prolyl oligopeptidase [Entophlyctis helioformis]|nr:prolyl oligopeptidase [Entophlyctis helioformis]
MFSALKKKFQSIKHGNRRQADKREQYPRAAPSIDAPSVGAALAAEEAVISAKAVAVHVESTTTTTTTTTTATATVVVAETAAPVPPVAKKVPMTHVYHGTVELHDDYHWLKDQTPETKRPEIVEYLEAENAYAKALHYDKNKELGDKIFNEIVAKISEDDTSVPVFRAPYYYYTRNTKGLQYPIYARKKDSLDGEEEILLDQNTFTYEYQSLGEVKTSPDHKTIAYSLDTTGAEDYTIFFKDIATGKTLDTKIEKAVGYIIWANDNKTVFYGRTDAAHRPNRVFRHTVGSDPKEDVLVYFDPNEKFYVFALKTNKYIFILSGNPTTTEFNYIDADKPDSAVKTFFPRQAGHQYMVVDHGNRFYILTNGGGKYLNMKLMTCTADNTDMSAWTEALPYDPYTSFDNAYAFKDNLIAVTRSDGLCRIAVVPYGADGVLGTPQNLEFPEKAYHLTFSSSSEQNFESNTVRFSYSSPLTPSQVWEYNTVTKERTLLKSTEVSGGLDASLYAIDRIHVPVPAGTETEAPFNTPVSQTIPVTIVYRKAMLKKDGTNPLHLYGYGSYGASMDNWYSPTIFPLLDRGFIYAKAHIRGGGDCGRGWYETGKFKHKKNTFSDFVACGDELVRLNYTQHDLMSMEGRSAGGLLMGAVLNLRPDLVHVAIAGVPFVDVINTMMDASIPLTTGEYEEWGNPNDKSYFDYMLSYSPYENVPKDAQFPHLLVKAGLNDPRVAYWEPAKWVAKLRDLNVGRGKTDILFDCKMGAGHFGVSGRYARFGEIAGDYAFLVDRMQTQQIAKGLIAAKF